MSRIVSLTLERAQGEYRVPEGRNERDQREDALNHGGMSCFQWLMFSDARTSRTARTEETAGRAVTPPTTPCSIQPAEHYEREESPRRGLSWRC